MALPNQALVMVADGTKMLFLRNHGDENQIDLRTESHNHREDRKDPEIKSLEKGAKLAKFSLATRDSYTNRAGEKVDDTQWHNITCWGKIAEQVEAELKKGSFVTVEGRISTKQYTDKSGQKRFFTEVIANEVTLRQKAAEAA